MKTCRASNTNSSDGHVTFAGGGRAMTPDVHHFMSQTERNLNPFAQKASETKLNERKEKMNSYEKSNVINDVFI